MAASVPRQERDFFARELARRNKRPTARPKACQ